MQKQSDDSKTPFRRFIFYDKIHQIGSKIEKTWTGGGENSVGKCVTEEDTKESAETLAKLTQESKADILHAYDIAKECRDVFVKSEEARLNGMPSNANPIVMRTLTNAITESRRGMSTERESSALVGGAGDGKKADIKLIFDSYFGVKGGRVQFTAFVSQFLFSQENNKETINESG